MLLYRKVVYKSRGLCAIFQLFSAASIQVWVLFKCGLYAMFSVCKAMKAVWNDVTRAMKAKLDFVNVRKYFET